jgi:hypothetical protein
MTYGVGSRKGIIQVYVHETRFLVAEEQLPGRHWFCLPPGTVVEDWRVVGCRGHGAYGIVYRAVRVGHEAVGEVALKVALYPWDPRFMREVGLLSLVHHPSVPRLLGQGFWKHPSGGVTAYRLVTGGYPPSPVPQMGEEGRWSMVPLYLPPPHKLNRQVEPQLSTLIVRMLSLAPEERGSAGELAEALEAVAVGAELEVEPSHDSQEAASGADAAPPTPERPAGVLTRVERARPRARSLTSRPGLALAGVGVLLLLWAVVDVHMRREDASSMEQGRAQRGTPDAGPANLGDAVSAAPLASAHEPSEQKAIEQDLPPKPRPGQIRPDAKGHCPGRKQVSINEGCWVELSGPDAEECEQNGYVLIKEQCYAPALETRRKPPPTSDQPR